MKPILLFPKKPVTKPSPIRVEFEGGGHCLLLFDSHEEANQALRFFEFEDHDFLGRRVRDVCPSTDT